MNGQRTFLIRMIAFLVVVVGVIAALFVTLIDAFTANPLLNGVILGVLVIGVAFSQAVILPVAD